MPKWDGLNRRKFPRIKFPCLVVINKGSSKKENFLSHTENVGVGGVCLILKQSVDLFSLVDLELDLMDMKDIIKCKGKIVWNVQRRKDSNSKPLFYDLGVEFVDLDPADQKRIEDIIRKLVKDNKGKSYIV